MPILRANGAELYYEQHCDCSAPRDSALVLAHGMGGNHAIWFQQIPVLAQYFRIITFDHRGFGNSTDPGGYGRSAFVEDLKAILDHLRVERAVLVGQSMGGGTCISFSCQYPERVAALVVADSLHALEESTDVAAIMERARVATAELDQIERVLGQRMRRDKPSAAVLYRQINSFNAVTRHTLTGAFARFTPAQLSATGIPVWFVAGVEDVLFPIAAIRLVQGQVTGSKMVEVPDCGHSAFYENPEEFNAALCSALL